MKLSDDFDNEQIKAGLSLGTMIIGIFIFIGIILFAVLISNKDRFTKSSVSHNSYNSSYAGTSQAANGQDQDYPLGGSGLVSDDLDFWDMYKDDDSFKKDDTSGNSINYTEKLKKLEQEEAEREKEEDLSENGTKTEVILPDGTSQWIMVNAYLKKNDYDYTGLVSEEPFMRYYSNAKKVSKQGIMLDESYGNVNFESLRKQGIDFCILRIGKRGYTSGSVTYDSKFTDYAEQAKKAGLSVGVSFYSQAVTNEEAAEEAGLIYQALQNYGITPDYPIIFDMEYITDSESRTKDLTKQQLTDIARTFCSSVKELGYSSLIYGDKYWLLRKIDLVQLTDYGTMLSQRRDVPDYPYEFVMWEYNADADVNGVSQKAVMCMSFIDYDMR